MCEMIWNEINYVFLWMSCFYVQRRKKLFRNSSNFFFWMMIIMKYLHWMPGIWNGSINRKIIGSNLIEFRFPISILAPLHFIPLKVSLSIKELVGISRSRGYGFVITSLLLMVEGWRMRVSKITSMVITGPPSTTSPGWFIIAT